MTTDQEIYREAKRQINRKKGFYRHFSVYLAVGLFLFLLDLLTGGGVDWFFYPMLSWGLAVLIQYFSVFGIPGTNILSDKWEEQQMEELVTRLEKKRNFYFQSMKKVQLLTKNH
ncbi:MAG: 2TM domain-containing protein [Saprospiraceae bacterium]|nr:2TM domain-containing protein [Saprospiraceae bacterium]